MAVKQTAGTVLFKQGDESNAFYIVQSGKVRIVQNTNPDGSGGRELAVLKDGDFFGEMGVIEDSPRSATAICLEDSQLLVVKRSDFDNLMALNPGIAMKIMVTITRRYKPDPGMAVAPQPQQPVQAKPQREGTVIAINSITGGAGVTTLVCNMGYELQKVTNGRVCLVDGSTQFGDLPVFLDVIPKLTLFQLAEETDVTIDMLNKGYIHKTNFAVDFVAAPMKPEQADVITTDLLRVLINSLRTEYDFVVVDTYSLMQEPVLTILELADQIIYLMTPDIPAMKNCRLWMELVKQLEFPEEKIKVVINKYDPRGSVDVKAIEEKLATKAFAVLPYDYNSVVDCINKGVLLNVAKPKDPLAERIAELARKIVKPGEATAAATSTGGDSIWGSFRKRFGLGG
ncbi:MAG: cyclic nucleotide-binding domain-containing protein [Candidatus Riflebacteria bacterium]|nr:cyclic nucleotide-binding domain-containing protein [Candidatus Riflebacteria bacterium]